jgi:DNA repair exonuclease SbcCD nuclease subunit
MKPVRFIHTSDIHLDTGFSGSGFSSRLGDRKREAIRGTFRRMMEDARIHNADFVLIAGDLYESERVTPDTIEFLKRQFEGLKDIPIFIAPGNHDPCVKGSPYREEVWPLNVHIFNAEEFQSVELPDPEVRITGFGFNRAILEERFFQRLPVLSKDRINVVLAHASDMSRVPVGKSKHGPFALEEIAGKNIQYCALGHYHQQHLVANPLDDSQIWYSGIPEGRGWDEEGDCGYLLCSIDESGIRVESRICSQFNFNSLSVDCETFSTREQILDAVLQYKDKKYDSQTLLRIRLTGALDPRLDLSLSELEERLSGECLFIQWDDQTYPALDFEALAQEKTLRGRFVRILSERIAAASENDRIILERARLYGVQALNGREVRLR